MIRLELRETIDAPWLAMDPVVIGEVPSGLLGCGSSKTFQSTFEKVWADVFDFVSS